MTRLLVVAPRELTADIRVVRQVTAARARGLEVAGLCATFSWEEPTDLDGVPVARVPAERASRPLRRLGLGGPQPSRPLVRELRGLWRLARLARTTLRLTRAARTIGAADIVHANEFDALPAGFLVARRWGARLVYDAHELHAFVEPDPPRLYRAAMTRLERALARRAAAVVTNCDPYADVLERQLRIRERPIVVLNAPDLEPMPERPRADRLRAVYQAGPDQPTRPVSDLVLASERAPGVDLAIRVVHFDRAALERLIEERGVAERVRILEPVAAGDLVSALAPFDVGVILLRPLTLDSELSQPGKLLEYMMAGLAVVVPRLPGMAPLVESEGIGLTYAPDRPDELGEALERLAADPAQLTRMQSAARYLAETRFNAAAQAAPLAAAWGLSPS